MMLRKLGMLGHIAHMLYIAINIDLGSWANLRRKGEAARICMCRSLILYGGMICIV